MPTKNVNCIEIYYERAGQGPPLLFINGSGATLAGSGFMIDLFSDRSTYWLMTNVVWATPPSPMARTRWPTTARTPPPCARRSAGTATA